MAIIRSDVPTISHLELEQLIRDIKIHIIDVRELDYFVGHIPGSRHIPAIIFDDEVDELARHVSVDAKPCIVSCSTGELRSINCALQLLTCLKLNFGDHQHDVRVLKGGFVAWERHFATQDVGGRYISRRICFDQYSQFGLPISEPSRRGQAGQVSSCGAHALGQQKQLGQQRVSKSVSMLMDEGPWRGIFSVGDNVQIRHCGRGQWSSGVITDSTSDSVLVRYFHENRSCLAIIPMSSPDLQPVKAKKSALVSGEFVRFATT